MGKYRPVFVQITLSDSNPGLLDQPISELSCIIKTFSMYINSSTLHNACVLWQPDMHRHISGTAAASPRIHIPCKGEISPNPVSSDCQLFFFFCVCACVCVFFPHSTSLVNSSFATHGGGVPCQTSYSLPPSHSARGIYWKNYSDICMCQA